MDGPTQDACIFCAIARGEDEAARVYEDEAYLAFMDKAPINEGHVLVMPKAHYDTLLDMPPEDVGPLFARVAELAAVVKEAMGADGINIGQNNGRAANQIVFHVHVHVIPRYEDDSPRGRWPTRRTASVEDLRPVARRIRRTAEARLPS